MSANIPEHAAKELGQRLYAAGFRPLPDVDSEGELIGTRLWRVHAGHVEYLALQPHGLAHAVRARASFNYQWPTGHGSVVEHRSAYASNALDWLLRTADLPAGSRLRPYIARNRPND